jgi:hypothetical protein
MPGAVALPTPEPLTPRRKRGPAPYTPTPEIRKLITVLAGFGISQPAMVEVLKREGLPCTAVTTLRRSFRTELKLGKEMLITSLGLKLYEHAMSDKPTAYNALVFLLKTVGGQAWRTAETKTDEVPRPADSEDKRVHIYIPDNGRQRYDTLHPDFELEPEPDFIRAERERREAEERTIDGTSDEAG